MASMVTSKRIPVLVAATILSLSGRRSVGEELPLSELLSRMDSFYSSSPGITADFEQTLESRTLNRPIQESGNVSLKPPGRMRWEYLKPRGKLAITDGVRAYLYLPDDEQVFVGRIQDLDRGAVASGLLLGTASLRRDFNVEGELLGDEGERWLLKLTPRVPDFPYDSVTLEVEQRSGAIRRIVLLDPLGNRVEYRFNHLRVVHNLPDRLFAYRIPKGVDVQVLREEPGVSASPP